MNLNNLFTCTNNLHTKTLTTESQVMDYVKDNLLKSLRADGVKFDCKLNFRYICSAVFERAEHPLSESLDPQLKNGDTFLKKFNELDQFKNIDINVGSKVAILNLLLTRTRAELWGFTNPKTITNIHRDPSDDSIKQFEFNNDPNDVWPRHDLSTFNGETIDHSAFFANKKDADQALTMLMASKPENFEVKNHIKESAQLAEGAIDELEKRRIEDLEAKMDDLAHRAKESKDPKVVAALRHEFAKCKAERDSYHYVQEWEDTAPGHDADQTELTPVEEAGSPVQQAAIAINMKKHNQKPKTDEGMTDYQKRRQRERDVDMGKPVSRALKNPQTDYAKKRAQDKRDMELGEAEERLRVSPHDQGSFAALKGKPYDSNPHPVGSKEHLEWSKGHNAMRARKADLDEHGGGGAGPREWHNYVKAHRTDESSNNVDPILLKALKRMPDGLKSHHEVLSAAYDAYAMEKGYLAMKGNHGVTDVYIPQLMGLYKDKHGLTFNEGWQDFNKVEPYAVCLAGKPIKKFDYYEEARRFHDNWKQKLYREGNKEKADRITLMPLDIDEGSMADAEHHHTGPEFTGYWKGTDSATPGDKMVGAAESKEFKVPAARNFVAKNAKTGGAGQHKDAKRAAKQGDVKHKARAIPMDMEEGAKVDRMQQHIAKSEKALGHSKKDAEAIGWATLNKRGYLDNANKKKHNESVNFMEWAVAQGSRFPNFTSNPEVYAQAKAAFLAEGFGTALANVSSKISGHPRKMKTAQQIRNKATKFAPQPIAETDVEEDYVSEIKKGQKDSNGYTSCWPGYHAQGTKKSATTGKQVRNCVPNESVEEEWSQKYKDSINCSDPKGFSQKAHCAGKSKNESFNGEYDDEAGMAQGNLYTIAKAAEGLLDTIGPRDNLPEWAQEKIAKVEGMMVTVWNYLQSQKAQGIDPQVTEDWQKANKKDKTDGMSRKAVKAYRREHPGSKLKTAVTTKPSKLKKGSKASKRRKSYCSRSKGQMKMHSISCAKTPDKAICKARRRWNCEGVENLDAMLAEAIEKGTLQPGQYYIWTVYFDDGSSKRIKVTKDNFDPKAYYAKQNKVVINTEYNWEPHNG